MTQLGNLDNQTFGQYIQEIQDYLKLQREQLEADWKNAGKNLTEDCFPELTMAIDCLEHLKSVQTVIYNYYDQIG